VGTDPHSFDPTPQDVAKVAEADLVFANRAGLEVFLDPLIESAGVEDKVIHVSDGIDFLVSEGEHDHDHAAEEHHDEHEGEQHDHEGVDPHTGQALIMYSPGSTISSTNSVKQTPKMLKLMLLTRKLM
jgi:zinc transport system substrate-binding protein